LFDAFLVLCTNSWANKQGEGAKRREDKNSMFHRKVRRGYPPQTDRQAARFGAAKAVNRASYEPMTFEKWLSPMRRFGPVVREKCRIPADRSATIRELPA